MAFRPVNGVADHLLTTLILRTPPTTEIEWRVGERVTVNLNYWFTDGGADARGTILAQGRVEDFQYADIFLIEWDLAAPPQLSDMAHQSIPPAIRGKSNWLRAFWLKRLSILELMAEASVHDKPASLS